MWEVGDREGWEMGMGRGEKLNGAICQKLEAGRDGD